MNHRIIDLTQPILWNKWEVKCIMEELMKVGSNLDRHYRIQYKSMNMTAAEFALRRLALLNSHGSQGSVHFLNHESQTRLSNHLSQQLGVNGTNAMPSLGPFEQLSIDQKLLEEFMQKQKENQTELGVDGSLETLQKRIDTLATETRRLQKEHQENRKRSFNDFKKSTVLNNLYQSQIKEYLTWIREQTLIDIDQWYKNECRIADFAVQYLLNAHKNKQRNKKASNERKRTKLLSNLNPVSPNTSSTESES